MHFRPVPFLAFLFLPGLLPAPSQAQTTHEYNDSLVVSNGNATIVVNNATGKVGYRFAGGTSISNTVAYMQDLNGEYICSADFSQHPFSTESIQDEFGTGMRINLQHTDIAHRFVLLQRITLYGDRPLILLDVQAISKGGNSLPVETRNISPLAVLPSRSGSLFIPGTEPRILDMPFDNDDWVGVVERKWGVDPPQRGIGTAQTVTGAAQNGAGPAQKGIEAAQKGTGPAGVSGISYEVSSIYDNTTLSGLVIGSLSHDFWKTGIAYRAAADKGWVDSFTVFGGVATPDDPSLPHAYGGQDGTHDHMPHGTQRGASVQSPVIYLAGGSDVRAAFTGYGEANAQLNGRLSWKGYAPVYWNSFGVEGVLGYEKVMMPPGVGKTSDFIHTLSNFNKYAAPVLSIDSYDQGIYTTELLASLSKYGKKQHQQMGFYFIPFALWTWKNQMDQAKLSGTPYNLTDVVLKDRDNKPIAYKDGDWGAFPLDPTHPGTRQRIIGELLKAKAINATFLKIDFLTAGALESSSRYDPSVRSGIQAYNQGMKMLKHLIDSILGSDIFITQAISPLFPHQYAHTRFVSTDVYSHLRDDEKGFPNWGSTEASLATGSHIWWVQGTLWPYTNLDVCVMKNFQKNPDLSEQEIKVRIYAMMAMGSILGDGSDFRQPLAAERAKKFLDNPSICAFFSHPRAFTPLQFADGDSFDQQLAFYLKADNSDFKADNPGINPITGNAVVSVDSGKGAPLHPTMLALFNFSNKTTFSKSFRLETLGLTSGKYLLKDFMTGTVLGTIEKDQDSFSLTVPEKDAYLLKIIPVTP